MTTCDGLLWLHAYRALFGGGEWGAGGVGGSAAAAFSCAGLHDARSLAIHLGVLSRFSCGSKGVGWGQVPRTECREWNPQCDHRQAFRSGGIFPAPQS